MQETSLEALMPSLEQLSIKGRTALLPALHAVQEAYGYIPEAAAQAIAEKLNIPPAEVYGVITFYSNFRDEGSARSVIHVCSDPACVLAGADRSYQQLKGSLPQVSDEGIAVDRVPCLGLCDIAPCVMVTGGHHRQLTELGWEGIRLNINRKHHTRVAGDPALITRNCGKGKTTSLSDYRASGGYIALEKALMKAPADVINQVKISGLVGRGGAAFPTGLKWESAAASEDPVRYLVCNADEAEPGAFKDRVIMEDDPHRIIEGIIIAAYAIGASNGFVYIRGEYTEPYEIMRQAVAEAQDHGLLGKDILGMGFSFQLELRRGAGAYICGEETALFESIEGKRGLPRIKPPFPTTHGLFGKPTVINNVETLSNIPEILRDGPEVYRSRGTERSTGTKLFCLSGDVEKPGLYEMPFGVTLRRLIFDLAGGVKEGKPFFAALIGGAAGGFASEKDLDIPLTFEDTRQAGIPLGAGVVTVFDDTRDLRQVILRLAQFFAEESCGKCYPCQLGTQRQVEVLERLAAGKKLPGDRERLEDIGRTMTDASICGLGQTASMAVLSALHKWPDLIFSSPDVKGGA